METIFRGVAQKYIFQKEIAPSTGREHLQGYIEFLKKTRPTELKLDKSIHWEQARDKNASIAYCQKSDTSTGDRWSYGFPKPIKTITDLRPWQKNIVELCNTEPDDRTINWYWSKNGNIGKSALTKYLVIHHKAIFCVGGQYADLCNLIFNTNMDDCKIVIFDLPRNTGAHISYSALESIKNGLISNTKYETGFKAFNSPHVIVFSNDEPEAEKMSKDRWKITNLDTQES